MREKTWATQSTVRVLVMGRTQSTVSEGVGVGENNIERK